jgi:simple sugar transport system permease protein
VSLAANRAAGAPPRSLPARTGRFLSAAAPTLAALGIALIAFALFLLLVGAPPAQVFAAMWRGAFGTWFSIENSLVRAAPLMLISLCTALPAALGLVVIGGEGAVVLGGLAAAITALWLADVPPALAIPAMAVAAFLAGAALIGMVGMLRHWRGVNETISSLLVAYLAIALFNHLVRGPLRDPKTFNYPGTFPIPREFRIGDIPGLDVHWGLLAGLVTCVIAWLLIDRTVFGFAARFAGQSLAAARLGGLAIGRLTITLCALGGGAAGLAGFYEAAAVIGRASGALNVGYGFSGILVAFVARHRPLILIPAAILVGGVRASSSLVQRDFGLPDATITVFEGLLFLSILASEFLRERWQPKPGGSSDGR